MCPFFRFYVYRAWGRVGTTIGGTKLENFADLQSAMENFEEVYEEKTGNAWRKRSNFVKYPNRFYPMDLDYGEEVVFGFDFSFAHFPTCYMFKQVLQCLQFGSAF